MRFELTADEQMIRESVRRFVDAEVKPHAVEWDKRGELPVAVIRALAELGMMGMMVEPDLGGAGLGAMAAVIALEEIARGDASLALSAAVHNLIAMGTIEAAGSDEQKRRLLPAMARGERLGSAALSSSDLAAVPSGERWVLSGSASFVAPADPGALIVVHAGGASFVVDSQAHGLSIERIEGRLGLRASSMARVSFDRVDAEQLRGSALAVTEQQRLALAAVAVGIGQASVEASRQYALDRRQFERAIAEFQAIQWMIADMATEIDAARLLLLRAADLADRGEALDASAGEARVFAAEAAERAAMKAIQIHGGYGYTREFAVERYLRDAKVIKVLAGGVDVERSTIARSVLER
jgi:alkylation response protein AidB-like acyl-CoA dehydrogenase